MNRSELIEAMARERCPEYLAEEWCEFDVKGKGLLKFWQFYAKGVAAELSRWEAAIPGLSDLIDGTAVVVPVEMTGAMEDATETACGDGYNCCIRTFQYDRLLAASPYGGKHE